MVFLVSLPLVVLVLWMNSAPQDLSGSMSVKIMIVSSIVIACIFKGKDIVDKKIDRLLALMNAEHAMLRDALDQLADKHTREEEVLIFTQMVKHGAGDPCAHAQLFSTLKHPVIVQFMKFVNKEIDTEDRKFIEHGGVRGDDHIAFGARRKQLELLRGGVAARGHGDLSMGDQSDGSASGVAVAT